MIYYVISYFTMLVLAVLHSLVGIVLALYEKEAGHYDWKIPLIGNPIGLSNSPETGSIIVASSSGVIGSIDASDGHLLWKMSQYSREYPITGLSVVGDSSVHVSFSGASSVVLDLVTGALLGHTGLPVDSLSSNSLLVGSRVVKVVPESALIVCTTVSGAQVWTREESMVDVSAVYIVDLGGVIGDGALAWLMGSLKIALVQSEIGRLVGINVAVGEILWGVNLNGLDLKILENRVYLLDAQDGLCVNELSVLTGELIGCSNWVAPAVDRSYSINDSTIHGRFQSRPSWKVHLPSKNLSHFHQECSESIPVIVKSDASVVLKYINPNLMVVAGELNDGLDLVGIDTVTGVVVFDILLDNASFVSCVVCENWIVCHYLKNHASFEVISIDLFDPKENLYSEYSSAFDLPIVPSVVFQQYVFPYGSISAMAVSSTLRGVTPRQILFATNRGIVAIRKDIWLNPQRGTDDQLPSYTPNLPVIRTDIISHKHVLENIKRLVAMPTHLESTSIVLAVGGDIFCSPVYIGNSPFDVLSPFFDYKLLYASVASVGVALVITHFWAKRTELGNKWK